MASTRLHFIDELTRAEAKNARAARQEAKAAPFRKTTQLMAYVRSLLPKEMSNAELCRALQLSDSTRRRLDAGESIPDFETLHHLKKVLSMTDAQYRHLQKLAYALHTRFGAVMRCCLKLAIHAPEQINGALMRHVEDTLYTPEDIEQYDYFLSDYRDWVLLCRRVEDAAKIGEKLQLSAEDMLLKDHFDRFSYDVQDPQPLVRWIVNRLEPPMRPGHFYRFCTLSKAIWEGLNKPDKAPREKPLWKIAVGLRLSPVDSQKMMYLAYSEAEKQKGEDAP